MKKYLIALGSFFALAICAQIVLAAPYPTGLGGLGTSQTPASGTIPIGNGAGSYTPALLAPGSDITITNASGSVTIAVQGNQFLPSSTVYVTTVNGQSGVITITSSTLGVATNTISLFNGNGFTTTTIQSVLNSLSASGLLTYSSATGAFGFSSSTLNLGTASTHPASDFLASSTNLAPSTTIPTVFVSSFNGGSGAITYAPSTTIPTNNNQLANGSGFITTSTFNATGTAFYLTSWNASGNGLTPTSSVFQIAGFVGFGTVTPSSSVDIENNNPLASTTFLTIGNGAYPGTSQFQIGYIATGSAATVGLTTVGSSAYVFKVNSAANQLNGTTVVRLLANGHVLFGNGNQDIGPFDFFGAPLANSSSQLIALGSNTISAGNANGTVLGSNQVTSYKGDFLNFEVNSSSMFEVSATGTTNTAGNLNVSGTLMQGGIPVCLTTTCTGGGVATSSAGAYASGNIVFTVGSSTVSASSGLYETSSTGALNFVLTNASGSQTYSASNDSSGFLEINVTGTTPGNGATQPYNIVEQNCPNNANTGNNAECTISQSMTWPDGSRTFTDWTTEDYPPYNGAGWYETASGGSSASSSFLFPFSLNMTNNGVHHSNLFTMTPVNATGTWNGVTFALNGNSTVTGNLVENSSGSSYLTSQRGDTSHYATISLGTAGTDEWDWQMNPAGGNGMILVDPENGGNILQAIQNGTTTIGVSGSGKSIVLGVATVASTTLTVNGTTTIAGTSTSTLIFATNSCEVLHGTDGSTDYVTWKSGVEYINTSSSCE